MKKLFNYALLAAALLVGVNVNAVNDCTVSIDGGEATPANFQETMVAIATNAGDVYTSKTIDIKLTDNVAIVGEGVPDYPNTWNIKHHQVINIDLNEKNIVGEFFRFRIKESTLNLTGRGILQNTDENENSACMLYAIGVGTDALIEADATRKTVMTIGKDVTILNNVETAKSTYGVGIMNSTYVKSVSNDDNENGSFGVTVTIDGTVNALNPVTILGTVNKTEGTYLPVININGHIIANAKLREVTWYEGDVVKSNSDEAALRQNNINYYKTTHAALYAAGFGVYNIKGTLEGGIGAYIKGGKIDIKDATIKATSEEFWAPIAYGSGYVGAGSALVVDNNAGYAGKMDVTIDGNTKISSQSGYGIQEVVTKGEVTTQNITIKQGEIIGAEGKGSIVTTEVSKDYTNIEGGTFNSDITEYLGENNIITPVDNGDGTTSYVIGTKDPDKDWKDNITTAEEGDYVKVPTGENQVLTDDVEAEYLVQEGTSTITVPEDVTLTVGEIVMSAESKIVVKPGAALVVKGDKGIVANNMENIVVETRSDKAGALLLDPNVTSNKNPKATVRFYSKAYGKSASDNLVQLFGCPMVQVDKIESSNNSYKTQFDVWRKNAWDKIGVLNGGGLDYSKFDLPFGLYCITSNNPSGTLLHYDITGSLLGNSQPATLNLGNGYISIANSWTGMMDVETIIKKLMAISKAGHNELQAAIYVYTQSGTTLTWEGKSLVDLGKDIKPMEAIMILNEGNGFNSDLLSYKDLVFDPATKTEPVGAPTVQSWEKASIRIAAENQVSDRVVIAQGNQFSSDFENGYDTKKYMNEEVCVYVNADQKYDIFATDDVNNTFVGFNCKNAGKYTISFEDVNANFVLVDNKTNARIEMAEGTTYEFLAEAGEDAYRFTIVAGAKAPTDMQKTNAAVKATRALINGQIVISNGERFFNVLGAEVK